MTFVAFILQWTPLANTIMVITNPTIRKPDIFNEARSLLKYQPITM